MCAPLECKCTMRQVSVCQYPVVFIVLLYYNCMIFFLFFFMSMRNVNQCSRKKCHELLGQHCTGFLPIQWLPQEY